MSIGAAAATEPRARYSAASSAAYLEAHNHMVAASIVQSVCPHNTRGILAEMQHRVHVAAALVRWTVR